MNLDASITGRRISQRRKEHKYTQEVLAEKLEISQTHLSSLEGGKRPPTTEILLKICNILGETPDYYLLGKSSELTDEITDLIKSLSLEEQKTIKQLLITYRNREK